MKKRTSSPSHVRALRTGFTLVEMLVVIGITTIVSAAAIVYSTTGQNEIALTVETAKVAQLILQARELALDTYAGTGSDHACGFGVHFDLNSTPRTYSLFEYVPGTPHCPSAGSLATSTIDPTREMFPYAQSSWQLTVAKGADFIRSSDAAACVNTIGDILFYPPAPTTLIALATDNDTFKRANPESTICLRTSDGKNTATITINPAGQVSF